MFTIEDAAAALREHRISSIELTRAVLSRIERYDSNLHAFNAVYADSALEAAGALDGEIARNGFRGPLHGIPVAIKDLCDLAGTPTRCASRVPDDTPVERDSTVVAKLRSAGAVIVGKTNMTEFALIGYHPRLPAALNAWGRNRWPGLSSSGSGAAVAASMCFAAIGTDTGGSIRFPAAANGVVGIKPTYGRVSRTGVFPLSYTFDHVGPLARSVTDAETVLEAVAGHDPADAVSLREIWAREAPAENSVRGMRFGFDEGWIRAKTAPAIADAIIEAARTLVDLGALRVDLEMPEVAESVGAWLVICAVDSLVAHRGYFPDRARRYGPAFRENLEYGVSLSAGEYAEARMVQDRVRAAYDQSFVACDALLMPATADVAGVVGERTNEAAQLMPSIDFSMPGNFTGRPSITMPCGFSDDEMPIALQIVGNLREETVVCRFARAYEAATSWHRRRPRL